MKSSDHTELVPASTHYADGDVGEGHDLEWRIMACLRSRIPDLRGIHITVFGNTAALRGEVCSLNEKRLFLECCRHVPGVMGVVEDLTVTDETLFHRSREEEWS